MDSKNFNSCCINCSNCSNLELIIENFKNTLIKLNTEIEEKINSAILKNNENLLRSIYLLERKIMYLERKIMDLERKI